ncbi:unnamed protein product [Arctia plantaginis]|uniref:Uncharacterized protein n=1 Tax=Arctia plantaginis TaxID=874455 RepID=A0A8S0ZJ01_ARCPL|nr:unnamed protein product [Arctia plantaginis]
MEPIAAINTDIKDPSHDIDKEITDLENLIRKLQTEIFEMSQNASKPLEEYIPNFEEYNNTSSDTRADMFNKPQSKPNDSIDSVRVTFKKLWNDSSSATTSNTTEQNVKNDSKKELQGKTGNKYFDDDFNFNFNVSILKDYIDANKKDFEQLENKNNDLPKNIDENESKPLNDEQNEPKTPIRDEKISDQPVNNNTKFGLLMRVFGNTSTSDEKVGIESSSAGSIGRKILEALHINKSKSEPSNNMSSKKSDTSSLGDSSMNTTSIIPKVKPYVSENVISKDYGEVNTNNDFVTSKNHLNHINIQNSETPQPSNANRNESSSMQKDLKDENIQDKYLHSHSISNFIKPEKDCKKQSNKALVNKNDDSETPLPQKVSIINIYIDLPKQDNSKQNGQQEDITKTVVLKPPKSKTSVPSIKLGVSKENIQIKQDSDAYEKSPKTSNSDISQTENQARVNDLKCHEIKKSNTLFDMASRFLNSDTIKDHNIEPEHMKNSKSSLNTPVQPIKDLTKFPTDTKTVTCNEGRDLSNDFHHKSDCNVNDHKSSLPKLDENVSKKEIFSEGPIVTVEVNQVAETLKNNADITNLVSQNINNETKKGTKTVSLTIIEPEEDVTSKNQLNEANKNTVQDNSLSTDRNQINANESVENVSFENEDFTDEYESLADDDENESLFEDSFHNDHPIIINNTHITINNGDNQSDVFEDSQDFTREAVPMDPKRIKKVNK